jgi:hypothetical protein
MSESHERRRVPGVSYSWRRAIGLSGFLNGIARRTGVPTSRSGRQRKVGQFAIKALGVIVLGAIALGYYAWTHPEAVKQVIAVIETARAA